MVNTIRATGLGVKRYLINGNSIGTLFLASPIEDTSGDAIGLEVMKVSCPYGLLDTLRNQHFPCELEVKVNLKAGTGGKIGMSCVSVTLLPDAKAVKDYADAAQSTTKKV